MALRYGKVDKLCEEEAKDLTLTSSSMIFMVVSRR